MCRRPHFDWAASRYVDPQTIVASTARKFERVKAFVIEHRQEHVTVFWHRLKDEIPHGRHLESVRQFRIDSAQSARLESK
jgi:hypothetical protein